MRKIVALLVIILCLATKTERAFPLQSPDERVHDWVWNVLVVPPSTGWDNEPGKSIKTALAWCEREISESSNGIGGHDVKFVLIPESEDFPSRTAANDPHTVAVMSFTHSPEADKILVARFAGANVPLMLAGGESVLIDIGGRPVNNIFALDMYRDYRCQAFTEYAKRIYSRKKRIALAASRFTVNQEREAKICYALLDSEGFMPMPYWTDASARDSYYMISEEIESYEGEEAGVVISFMGSMGAREIWRNFMRIRTNWRLWNVSEPDELYLSCRGMIFADQNVLLSTLGGFIETRRTLWRTRAMQVADSVAAGRAIALYEWFKRAVDVMPQPVDNMPRGLLLQNLGRVQGIPFGNQVLDISPGLHRPSARNVYIVEIRNREYSELDTVNTRALAYVPAY
ncbi:MAG: hypothetical protein IJR63_08495 [Synergistaceae bacterium]|nr:hypothetical protein [Synergistaceae bacterium]